MVHATPLRGVVRCIGPGTPNVASLAACGTVIGERLPAAAWATIDGNRRDTGTVDRLARDLRATFDPARVLNPGILGA